MTEEVGKIATSAKLRVSSHHSQNACDQDVLSKYFGLRNNVGFYQSEQFKLTRFSPPAPAVPDVSTRTERFDMPFPCIDKLSKFASTENIRANIFLSLECISARDDLLKNAGPMPAAVRDGDHTALLGPGAGTNTNPIICTNCDGFSPAFSSGKPNQILGRLSTVDSDILLWNEITRLSPSSTTTLGIGLTCKLRGHKFGLAFPTINFAALEAELDTTVDTFKLTAKLGCLGPKSKSCKRLCGMTNVPCHATTMAKADHIYHPVPQRKLVVEWHRRKSSSKGFIDLMEKWRRHHFDCIFPTVKKECSEKALRHMVNCIEETRVWSQEQNNYEDLVRWEPQVKIYEYINTTEVNKELERSLFEDYFRQRKPIYYLPSLISPVLSSALMVC
ncbi:hypothetical protein IW261DRAFT_1422204 [Armillaria novae-zelandiae]|uniref:Uncharacterized protein n=1 Tax=Armillaria novae-zelandiae TaxID=153914 RepID=A0AA39P0M8_9AGAR|nr:hypothetical protein IW261DRAFT_1422204 [Armillaria novae-zelandiae]